MRLLARFVILLVVLSVLFDLIGWTSMCFDPSLPFVALSPPICFVLSSNLLIEDLEKGGLPGLLWHYLPAKPVLESSLGILLPFGKITIFSPFGLVAVFAIAA